jgi:alpha-1,2-mannosyltransferase
VTGVWRLWPVLALAIVISTLAVDVWNHPEEIGIDFHTYEAAARVGLQQGWPHIYDQGLVAAAQTTLVPGERTQPYLSPPPVAWLSVALAALPYSLAFYVWAAVMLAAFALALVWSASSTGLARWIAVGGAIAPYWVLKAVRVGQVVPMVGASVVLAWRLVREDRQVAAGLILSLILLKPNTAILVPFALLAAGRYKTFVAWAAAAAAVALVAAVTLGPNGVTSYVSQLTGPLPRGVDWLTLERAIGVNGVMALVARLVIVGATLAAAFRLRSSPGLAIAVGILGSLLVAPYLHDSDLCLLSAAAFMVWEERPATMWRAPLVAGWLVATPFVAISGTRPSLSLWTLLELGLLVALVVLAWRNVRPRARDRVVGAR